MSIAKGFSQLTLAAIFVLHLLCAKGFSQPQADVVVIIDRSGSGDGEMLEQLWTNEITGPNVESLDSQLNARGIDVRWSAVGFAITDVTAGHVEFARMIDGSLFTSDVAELNASIAALPKNNTGDESAWLAIEEILKTGSEFNGPNGFRPNAGVHFIIVTDEGHSDFLAPHLVGPAGDRMQVIRNLLARNPGNKFDDVVVSVLVPEAFAPGAKAVDRHNIGYFDGDLTVVMTEPIIFHDTDGDGENDFVDVDIDLDQDVSDLGFAPLDPLVLQQLPQNAQDYVDLARDSNMPLIAKGDVWDSTDLMNRFDPLMFSWVTARRIEYTARIPGDLDDDGDFDSTDLVAVFESVKYETGELATFEEGDFDGDYFFDSSDIVFVFDLGHYQP